MKNNFAILVNTTDSFEDCWFPFFTLFKKYWTNHEGNIYLNTEHNTFTYEDLNIISLKNGLTKGTWSQCLNQALECIEEEYILYMQEDYFLRDFVDNNKLNELSILMNNNNIDCIHLTDQATPGPFNKSNYPGLLEIDKSASYRISTQAALWKKEILKKYLRRHETGWLFEKYGTKRSTYYNDKIYIGNNNEFGADKKEIIPYIFTGIIRGKWNEEVLKLFSDNNITVNFGIRGIDEPDQKIGNQRKYLSFKHITSIFLSNLEILNLRMINTNRL